MPGQNLLADVDLFAEPEVVLTDPKYWTPDFARLFIESWDDVSCEDAQAGRALAEVAVKLVAKLDEAAQEILSPRAKGIVGSSYRALGEVEEAARHLEPVLAEYKDKLLPRLDEADCYRRMAYLRRDQFRYDEAVAFAEHNITLCHAERALHEMGRGYGTLGAIYLYMLTRGETIPRNEPVESLSRALEFIDPRKSTSAYEAVTCNLAFALGQRQQCDIASAIGALKKALTFHTRNRITRKTLPGAQIRWMLALLYQRSGAISRAEELLKKARRVIYEKGNLRQYVRISLDLAETFYRLAHWGRLRILAEEILEFESGMSPDAVSALSTWYKAVRNQNVDPAVWDKVLKQVRWGPPRAITKVRPGQVERTTRRSHRDTLW